MSAGPKRHHHLPQFIQRAFLEKGKEKLWWYSRSEDRYQERTPRGIGHDRNTYTLTAIEGEERYALERAFSAVENTASPAFKKLAAEEDLNQEEHTAIAEFLGYQFYRTPSKIALIKKVLNLGGEQVVRGLGEQIGKMTPQQYRAYIDEHDAKSGKATLLSQEELVSGLATRPPKILSTKEGTLDSLVEIGLDLAIRYSGRQWTVLHAPKGASFITSSEGMFLFATATGPDAQGGPTYPGMATVFPFSRSAALIVEPEGPTGVRHTRTDRSTIRNLNDGLAEVSNEIYGSPRPLLESIVNRLRLGGTIFEVEVDEDRIRSFFAEDEPVGSRQARPSSEGAPER